MKPTFTPDATTHPVDLIRRERDAALKRCRELEAHLQLARDDATRASQTPREVIAAPLYRFVLAALHPDRVTSPDAKKYLQEAFIRFNDLVKEVGEASPLPYVDELMRGRAARAAKNSLRARKAASTRKARKEAAAGADEHAV